MEGVSEGGRGGTPGAGVIAGYGLRRQPQVRVARCDQHQARHPAPLREPHRRLRPAAVPHLPPRTGRDGRAGAAANWRGEWEGWLGCGWSGLARVGWAVVHQNGLLVVGELLLDEGQPDTLPRLQRIVWKSHGDNFLLIIATTNDNKAT
jgi:hypothetical protein